MMKKAFLSLGSNLGNKELNIKKAIEALQSTNGIDITLVSGSYETLPEGNQSAPKFINVALEIFTSLEPVKLLDAVQEIEKNLGRTQKGDYSPRIIDIDIILYDDDIIIEAELTIPHPLMHERLFVLEPLYEIAPDVVHPVMGETVKDLLDQLRNEYGCYN